MANALKTLFGEIAQAIRDQNGDPPEVKYKPVEFPAKIADLGGGGGSSADVRYVTFMSEDGSFEYGKKAVAVGDNCADPVARGVFSKPTKESTVQYTYTHYGWATNPNGAADSNWNKSITEDKTVYANFAAAVRYYTITYYDGSAVLKTESLAYGTNPTYTPAKDGYTFLRWEPSLESVTGDASYTVVWDAKPDFATATWAKIAEIAESGNAADVFKAGDMRTESIGGVNVTLVIAGFNHDDLADGSGKAGISILVKKTLNDTVKFKDTTSKTDPVHWENSDLRVYCNSTLFGNFSQDLQSVIKSVTKKSDGGWSSATLVTTSDKVWAPSAHELGLTGTQVDSTVAGQGTVYAYSYKDKITKQSGAYAIYHTRSCQGGQTEGPGWVIGKNDPWNDGSISVGGARPTAAKYLAFGFCI